MFFHSDIDAYCYAISAWSNIPYVTNQSVFRIDLRNDPVQYNLVFHLLTYFIVKQ